MRGAELGLGLHEMKHYQVAEDLLQWEPLVDWLELPPRARDAAPGRCPAPLTAGEQFAGPDGLFASRRAPSVLRTLSAQFL